MDSLPKDHRAMIYSPQLDVLLSLGSRHRPASGNLLLLVLVLRVSVDGLGLDFDDL